MSRVWVGERLDDVDELMDLLALHVDPEEREEFHYEVGFVLDSFIGPNAPGKKLAAA